MASRTLCDEVPPKTAGFCLPWFCSEPDGWTKGLLRQAARAGWTVPLLSVPCALRRDAFRCRPTPSRLGPVRPNVRTSQTQR